VSDVYHAARLLAKAPGFSAAAILILALGIAGNTAVFSAIDVFLLAPLPFQHGERLVVVASRHGSTGVRAGVTAADHAAWSAHATTLEAAAAVQLEQGFNVSGGSEPVRVTGGRMSATLLTLLGVAPLRGRALLPEDERPGAPPAVLITERFWDRGFDRAESVIGSTLIVDGVDATIVGVLPGNFRLLYGGYSIWAPLAEGTAQGGTDGRSMLVVGRLAPGSTPERTAAELAALAEPREPDPAGPAAGWRPRVIPMRDFLAAGRQHTLGFAIVALGALLLVACANTASLQLARGAARYQEIVTRLALGASRARVVRLLLAEAGIVTVASAALALGLVAFARKLLLASSPDLRELQISLPVLGFTLLLTVATTMVSGLVPALTATRIDLAAALRGASVPGRPTRRLLSALVVVELALSLVLLVPAGLLFRSFLALRRMDPGFAAGGVLTFSVVLPPATYPDTRRQAWFCTEALNRLGSLPGVRAAAAADALPLEALPSTRVGIDARTLNASTRTIGADYFAALGIRMLAGRSFVDADDAAAAPVAIVNETLAKAMRPDGRVLGARIRTDGAGPLTIVGVAADLHSVGLRTPPQPELMLSLRQFPGARIAFAVTADREATGLIAPARDVMRALDPDLPLAALRPMSEIVDEQVAAVRAIAALLAAVSALALVLASAGLSGLMSRLVAQRTREFGIRAALGATRRDTIALVMRDGATLVFWGLMLGLPAAVVVARVVSSQLWGVSAADAITFATVPAALALATCVACYVPAARAARLDPGAALRTH
jgi:putative ABC transport system permease protein